MAVRGQRMDSAAVVALNNTFERSLVSMHKMPRVWLDYLEFLMEQKLVTQTRRTFDRAMTSLPITQHDRLWELYLVREVKGTCSERYGRVVREGGCAAGHGRERGGRGEGEGGGNLQQGWLVCVGGGGTNCLRGTGKVCGKVRENLPCVNPPRAVEIHPAAGHARRLRHPRVPPLPEAGAHARRGVHRVPQGQGE